MNANLLRKWVRAYQVKHALSLCGPDKSAVLLPVVATEAPTFWSTPRPSVSDCLIEILIDDATVRVRGAVDAQQLRTVIDCLARRP